MTIIVEDGTGLADSETYIGVEEADAYHAARNNFAWDEGDIADKEAALRRATQYLDGFYKTKWAGYRTNGRAQALDWPRTSAYDHEGNYIASDEVPAELSQACAEAALRELVSPQSLSPDIDTGQRILQETVGPISTRYADRGSQRTQRTLIDELLSPLLAANGSMTQSLLRA
jgi:hypothetical protein